MIKISLVVCLYKERDLLDRLLAHCVDCYDDLVVVHDGAEQMGERSEVRDQISKRSTYAGDWKSPEELSLKLPDTPPEELAVDYAKLSPDAPIPTGYRLVEGDPQSGSVHEVVARHGGRFYESPRCFQQEPHWPFAWWAARHDWILRLDADEFPSEELRKWLMDFRDGKVQQSTPAPGFLGIWTQWDGKKELPSGRHANRLFLFEKRNVTFIAMAENSPSSLRYEQILLLLHHRPRRPSFGLSNLLLRKQANVWRLVIASSLLKRPTDLPRWRYSSPNWPPHWRNIREHPIRKILTSLSIGPLRDIKHALKNGRPVRLNDVMATVLHQSLMAFTYYRVKKSRSDMQ